MNKILKRVTVIMLALAMALTPCTIALAVTPMERLKSVVVEGKNKGWEDNNSDTDSVGKNYKKTTYEKEGGGYYLYSELTEGNNNKQEKGFINESRYDELTAGGRQRFLSDVLSLCNNQVAIDADYVNEKGGGDNSSVGKAVTTQTVNEYSRGLQNLSGAGSQLIASLMAETKPDYATANQIYKPFSGPVGVALGIIAILVMALLGVTMALDIAYIVIPAFQLMLDGGDEGGSDKGTKGMAKIISQEARSAVKSAADGGSGSQAGSNNKMAIGVYFKGRWKSLLILGICLLYLVQGQIYSLIAWIIDLVSGFVGS